MNSKELSSLVLRLVRTTFPDQDLTPGGRVWNNLINPLMTALGPSPLDLQFREFARAVVRTQHPTVDIEQDGEVDDLVLKPEESVLAPIVRELSNIRQRQTIRDLRMHTVESVSDIAANFGIIPAEGGYAQGSVRLYYNAPVSERVSPETYLETTNGLRFYASGLQSITNSQMTLNHLGDLYYFDIRVVAEKPGAVYNVEPGAISRAPTLSRVVRVANQSRLKGGLQQDTVETIAGKIENYPCTQSVGTRRGTAATCLANLPRIRVLETVGMGDIDMQRDVIKGGDIDGTSLLAGSSGSTPPDPLADMRTMWFRDITVNFTTALGVAPGAVDGYYLVAAWPAPKPAGARWVFEKVTQVIDTTTIEVENRTLPVNLSNGLWTLCPARLTLSEVPGGILWPDTPDGEIAIHSDEVHVGGQTDVYLMGTSTEDATVDIESLTDEDLLGYGLLCTTTAASQLAIVDDMVETAIAGPVNATYISPGVYDIASLVWGVNDMSTIHSGQVFRDPATMTQYRILALRKGTTAANCLQLLLDSDTGADVLPAYIIQRSPDVDLRNSCFRVAAGAASGYKRSVFDVEGSFADPPHAAGEYTGCRYKVVLSQRITAPSPADTAWFWSDDTDINLSDPKILRTDGTTLRTVAGSDVVFDLLKNFNDYGVVEGDILRIDAGADQGDHVLRADPFGAGGSYLHMSSVAKGTATVRYQLLRPITPIELPLLTVNEVEILGADGSPLGVGLSSTASTSSSLTLPYGEALGSYSETFTNLHRGEKVLGTGCVLGIASSPITVDGAPGKTYTTVGGTGFCLWVWHEQLGRQYWTNWVAGAGYITDGRGGFYAPEAYAFSADGPAGPYDLATTAGWDNLVTDLNSLSPYPHWSYVDVDPSSVTPDRCLVCRPFGAVAMLLGYTNALTAPLVFPNPILQGSVPNDWALDVLDTTVGGTNYSRTISSADIYKSGWLLSTNYGVGTDQDLFEISTGVNQGYADTVSTGAADVRARLTTPHAFTPDIDAQVRVGLPSTGLIRTYFKDPTDFEADGNTRFTTADGNISFIPDPTGKRLGLATLLRPLHWTLIPGYGEDTNPDNGWTEAGASPAWYRVFHAKATVSSVLVDTNMWDAGIRPGDFLEATYRDIVTTTTGVGWPYTPPGPGNELLTITCGDRTVIVTFVVGTAYTMQNAIDLINQMWGDTLAVSDMADATVHLRWQEPLSVSGTALAGGILGVATPPSSNTAYIRGTWRIADIRPDGVTGELSTLWIERGPAAFTLDTLYSRVQYRILRPGQQRWSAAEMSQNVGVGGLYYVDVEAVGYGVGDRFNIAEDTRLTITGSRARGYRLSATNPELSFSTAEEVWLHVDNYFQLPTADDSPANDQAVFGSGFRLHYERSPLVSSAQALLNSREERDNNQSVLARHLFPYYVNCSVSYAGGALESVVLPAIEDLITGRDPNEPLDVSDIVGVVTGMNADHVDLPIELAVLRHNKDRSVDVLVGKDRVETPRLAGFLPGNITLVRRA